MSRRLPIRKLSITSGHLSNSCSLLCIGAGRLLDPHHTSFSASREYAVTRISNNARDQPWRTASGSSTDAQRDTVAAANRAVHPGSSRALFFALRIGASG